MSGRRQSLAALASVLLALGACTFAAAGERSHVVRPGESASSIAKRYYGSYELADWLLLFNGRRGNLIHVGETLRVPFCDEHRVRSGEAWSVLAQRYLGRPDRYPAVARLNGLSPQDPLQVDQRIVFPVVLPHPLERGESLATLAERYYGEPGLGEMLREWNRIDDPRRLAVGERVEIPTVALRLRAEGAGPARPAERGDTGTRAEVPQATPAPAPVRSAAAAQPPEAPPSTPPVQQEPASPAPEPSPRFTRELRRAAAALDAGEYERARELLEEARPRVETDGTAGERAELWRMLATLYVAFDLADETCAALRALRAVEPGSRLDPDRISPKIREAFAACAPGSGT